MKELTYSSERTACSRQSLDSAGRLKGPEPNLTKVYLRKVAFDVGLLTIASVATNAQGITTGTTMSVGGSSLYLSGNWNDEGTFDPDTGTVVFNGTGRKTISDTSGEMFYNMTVDGSSDTVELLDNITVNNTAVVIGGNLDENGYKLSFGPQGDISLAVQSTDFVATAGAGSVRLPWKTQSEVNNAGFSILRNDSAISDVGSRISNWKLITSYSTDDSLRGLGTSSTGRSYDFTDDHVTSGATYKYEIQSVSTSGATKDLSTVTVTVNVSKA